MATFFHTKTKTEDGASQQRLQEPQEPHQDGGKDHFWEQVDQQFKEVSQAGRSAFVINKNINVILVIIGVTIIGSTLLYTWVRGLDPWSTIMGGIGIGSFVLVFFNNPQSNINKAVASLASIYMVYKGHKIEYDAIYNYYCSIYDFDRENIADLSKITQMNKALQESTKFYVDLINSHLEVFKADGLDSKNRGTDQKSKILDHNS